MWGHPTTLMFEKGTISMCIYCNTNKYRKIYEKHHGPIPREANGRSYDIHHIDGNRSNNDPANLIALSLQEHYDTHYKRGDWAACHRIGARLDLPFEELSRLSREARNTEVQQGTHPFQTRADGTNLQKDRVKAGKHHLLKREDGSSIVSDLVKQGRHHLLKRPDGSSLMGDKTKQGLNPFSKRSDGSSVASDQVKSGKHHWLKRADGTTIQSDRIKNGTHPSQQLWTCKHCNKSGKSKTNYTRWHGDNCKTKGP